MYRESRNGMDAREDNQKLGGILNRAVRAILHHCGCTKACGGNCKCCKAGLRCTFYVTVKVDVSTKVCFRLLL